MTRFRAISTIAQTIPTGSSPTVVSLPNVEYNIGNCYSDTTYKFTVPATGCYHFDALVQWNGDTTGTIICWGSFIKNGSELVRFGRAIGYNNGGFSSVGSVDLQLSAGDYIQLGATCANGTLALEGAKTYLNCHLVALS